MNQFDNEKDVIIVVTNKRIYIFKDNTLRRAHWISKLRGIIVSDVAPYEILLALPKKDLRVKGLGKAKTDELFQHLQN